MKTRSATVAALLLMLPLTACKRLGLPQPAERGAAANPLHLSSSDVAMQAKLQPAIHCINRTLAHYEDIEPAYEKRVAELAHPAAPLPPGAMPVIPPFDDYFEFKIEPYERNGEFATECATGLDKTISLSPADPAIDQPARDAAQAIRAILEPGSEMDAYLQQKAYAGDQFAKGRSLDATLTPLLKRIVGDSLQLRQVVRQQEASLRQHELDAIDKSEGHSLRWHTRKNLIEARGLNDALVDLARSHRLDPASVGAATKPLQDAYNDTETFLAQHPEAGKPNRYNNQPIWFSINNDLSIELGAANELRGILADDSLRPDMKRERVNSQLKQITSDFNGLVQTYNLMEQNNLGT